MEMPQAQPRARGTVTVRSQQESEAKATFARSHQTQVRAAALRSAVVPQLAPLSLGQDPMEF